MRKSTSNEHSHVTTLSHLLGEWMILFDKVKERTYVNRNRLLVETMDLDQEK